MCPFPSSVRKNGSGCGASNGPANGAAAPDNGICGSFSDVVQVVREKRLLRVVQSIESTLPRSVRELAQQVHLSPTHLQRLFKQETGVHIRDLLTERRLTAAANLLTTTDMEIKEIAYYVGYRHHSSFVRAFQRRFGQSPKRYRNIGAASAANGTSAEP